MPPGWVSGQVTAPLKQISFKEVVNNNNPIVCSGTVVIVDGCNFKVQNFNFQGALESKWYGGVVGYNSTGGIVSNQYAAKVVYLDVPASGGADSGLFTLIQPAGSQSYSFFSFNQLRLFDVAEQQVVCTADLPYQNPNAPPPPGGVAAVTPGSGGATATVGTTGATGTGKSSAVGVKASLLGRFAAMIAAALAVVA
ncbi:hypothetical protein HDU76_007766 [Blyttiomyces sp. JEL0837]|nr:hypothetical protein HDU76_007766 [Blyttiomyces sp. JEL0837]